MASFRIESQGGPITVSYEIDGDNLSIAIRRGQRAFNGSAYGPEIGSVVIRAIKRALDLHGEIGFRPHPRQGKIVIEGTEVTVVPDRIHGVVKPIVTAMIHHRNPF